MTITRNFELCLNAGTQNAPYINVNQYDEGEQWVFDLYTEGGQKFTPSTGAIIGIKADGNAILNSGTVNASGQVVITETEQMTAASGLAVFELLIEGETHGTANFIVNVERRPSDDAEFSDSDISLIQQALDVLNPLTLDELKANTKGTNLFINGQPNQTLISPADSNTIGWTRTETTNTTVDFVGGEYIHIYKPLANLAVNSNVSQINKYYKSNGSVYSTGHGSEIADLVGGADAVLTFEVKSNKSIIIKPELLVSFTDGGETIRTFNVNQTIANDNTWHTFSITDAIPQNWQTLIRQSNAKNVRFTFTITTTANVDLTADNLNVYIRNVKFEYGTTATPYTYSQYDIPYLILNNTE